jgi:hypothetical protein
VLVALGCERQGAADQPEPERAGAFGEERLDRAVAEALASLSRSRWPMRQKYSGSTASSAPACAACASSVPAASRLPATVVPDTVCKAAIFMGRPFSG